MKQKKKQELDVLRKFVKEFDENIIILTSNEAKSIFNDYNEENPDFIIRYGEKYIGVELFEFNIF